MRLGLLILPASISRALIAHEISGAKLGVPFLLHAANYEEPSLRTTMWTIEGVGIEDIE